MGAVTREWRTVEVRIPPEDDRYPDGWWVIPGGIARPGLRTGAFRIHPA